jgi:hypothetical protein
MATVQDLEDFSSLHGGSVLRWMFLDDGAMYKVGCIVKLSEILSITSS